MSKDPKKTFSDGLDALFDHAFDTVETVSEKDEKKKGNSKKSFSNDLSYFFQDAIRDVVSEKASEIKQGKKPSKSKRRTKPNFGLDSLIKQTIEESVTKPEKKRVTFTFETNKIDQLKSIAKVEKARIRDIVGELISDYIKKYETDK